MKRYINSNTYNVTATFDIQKVHLWPYEPYNAPRSVPVRDIPRQKIFGALAKVAGEILIDNHFDLYLDAMTIATLTMQDLEEGIYWVVRPHGTNMAYPDGVKQCVMHIGSLLASMDPVARVFYFRMYDSPINPEYYSILTIWECEVRDDG